MRRANRILVVLVVLVLASCTIPTHFELYNNAQVAIELAVGSDKVLIEPGDKAELGTHLDVKEIVVRLGPQRYRYDLRQSFPEEFVAWTGWGFWSKRIARLQFEPDGSVWLLGEGQQTPVSTFQDQPEGFPLAPIAV